MKVSYSWNQPAIIQDRATTADLIITFQETDRNLANRLPLNLSVVLDRSGSMSGYPLTNAKDAAKKLVEYLTPEDYISVVVYDDMPATIVSPQLVTDKKAIQKQISSIRSGGLTNLSGGWLMGCDRVKNNQSSDKLNRVLLLTDGQANRGIYEPKALINTAREKAASGIITTTIGFGSYFNEDLLISIADAAEGNFYFIQSPEDAVQVFDIEMESLVSVVAQNLTVKLQLEDKITVSEILNDYSSKDGKELEIFIGDVYGVEGKPLALQFELPVISSVGKQKVATITYSYETIVDDKIQQITDTLPVTITVDTPENIAQLKPDAEITQQASQLRIAKKKDEAIDFADKGDYQQAAKILREAIGNLKLKALNEYFEIAEEIEQLDYYAQSLEKKRFDLAIRKEMRDQSYQAKNRTRDDLKLRGTTGDAANSLPVVYDAESGVVLECSRIKGKLRIKVISEGYNPDFNVQFPRNIRQEGATYVVDSIETSANGTFYRVVGDIRRLLKPGETLPTVTTTSPRNFQKAKVKGTAADLETTDTVGNGVLVQCIKEKSKLRARVVSDGYDPDWNMRFPRSIREEGMMYVVDEVKESSQGGFYLAYGTIKKFVQS